MMAQKEAKSPGVNLDLAPSITSDFLFVYFRGVNNKSGDKGQRAGRLFRLILILELF